MSEELLSVLRDTLASSLLSYDKYSYLTDYERSQVDGAVDQIEQAFKDAGYIRPKIKCPWLHGDEGSPLMTGQEFYTRFNQELAGGPFSYGATKDDGSHVVEAVEQCKLAAKRAAGLES